MKPPGMAPGAKYQPLRIAHPTSQMHLGSVRTMFLDCGAPYGWNKSRLDLLPTCRYWNIEVSNARHFSLADGAPIPIIVLLYLFDVT